jgi:CubicO group peptidase (beta-lactamase class C family)
MCRCAGRRAAGNHDIKAGAAGFVIVALGLAVAPITAAPYGLEARFAGPVAQRVRELQVPGAIVGVWRGAERPWIAAFGEADVATRRPLTPDDHVRIASITKVFVGTVVLQLADEGKLALEDPVSRYVPGVPNGDRITLRQLGNMTSGLVDYLDDDGFRRTLDLSPRKRWTPRELLAIGFARPPYFAPGAAFHYSNTNTILLGLVIETVTGHPLAQEVRARVIDRLGLRETSFPDGPAIPAPYAHGYMYGTAEAFFTIPKPPDVSPRDVTGIDPSYAWAAGQMISTLGDLGRFAKAAAIGTLISARAQAERLTWVPTGGARYGFAILRVGDAIGHNGQMPGYTSFMGCAPAQDETFVVLANLAATRAGAQPADEIAAAILRQL